MNLIYTNIKKIIIGLLLIGLLLHALTVHANHYIATAYDLSPASCGKSRDHWAYGITASGYNLRGHTWNSARTVSADLSVHKLGTRLHITFPAPYEYMSGIYTVRDTGGNIIGRRLDIFFGEYAHSEALRFGRRTVYVTKI